MKFKVKVDKYFYIPLSITTLLFIALIVIGIVLKNVAQIILASVMLVLVDFTILSQAFAYAKLEKDYLYIKFGLILNKKIHYNKIRSLEKQHQWYSYSFISQKSSLDHVLIKYNEYDDTCISIKEIDTFIICVNDKRKREGQE